MTIDKMTFLYNDLFIKYLRGYQHSVANLKQKQKINNSNCSYRIETGSQVKPLTSLGQ